MQFAGNFARLLGVCLCGTYLVGALAGIMTGAEISWLPMIAILLAANGLIAWGNGCKAAPQ